MSCPPNGSLTDDELYQIYDGGILPITPFTSGDRENGVLTRSTVNRVIANLKSNGVIPTLTKTNTDMFFQNQTNLINNIKSEYCFYYSRYSYILPRLLKAVGDMNEANANAYGDIIQMLNTKMTDLIQLINGIAIELKATDVKNVMGDLNAEMKQSQNKLMEQKKIISSGNTSAKLHKEMVKYTQEKSRYTDNLLKVYSVLNIVALGLLVYVYKSAG